MGQNRARKGSEYRVGDPLESIQPWIKLLRKHCDGIILISHLGLKLGSEFAEVVKYGDKELAEALPPGALDMIVSGHTHDVEQAEYNKTPIAQVGSNASHLGEVDLVFTKTGPQVDIKPVLPLEKTVDAGPFFKKEIMPFLEQYSPFIQAPLSSQMGFCPEDENLEDSKGKLESPTADFLCEALYTQLRKQDVTIDFTAIDGSNINEVLFCDQTLSLKALFSLIPYSDTVKTLTMTAEELFLFIQDNARRVRSDGEHWQEKGFVYFSKSISYRIDSEGEAVDICFRNQDLKTYKQKSFTMGITSYMRGLARPWEGREQKQGRDHYQFPLPRAKDIGLSFRKQIIDYLKETAPLL
jgi:2',3'-cyclic-nucleotide 2'-phosphodiesterase (5'-nucleotidase family)